MTDARTIVDDFVKDAILRSYSIFPTREHVLNHLFLTTGNGFDWGMVNGKYEPVSAFRDDRKPEMLTFLEDHESFAERKGDPRADANIEFQDFLRSWTAKNIDMVSRPYFHFSGHSYPRPKPYPSPSTYSLFATLPEDPELIHEDWLDAVREQAQNTMQYIRSESYCGDADEVLLKRLKDFRPDLLEPAKLCLQVLQNTVTKKVQARQAAAKRITEKLMAEIKKEEAEEAEAASKSRVKP